MTRPAERRAETRPGLGPLRPVDVGVPADEHVAAEAVDVKMGNALALGDDQAVALVIAVGRTEAVALGLGGDAAGREGFELLGEALPGLVDQGPEFGNDGMPAVQADEIARRNGRAVDDRHHGAAPPGEDEGDDQRQCAGGDFCRGGRRQPEVGVELEDADADQDQPDENEQPRQGDRNEAAERAQDAVGVARPSEGDDREKCIGEKIGEAGGARLAAGAERVEHPRDCIAGGEIRPRGNGDRAAADAGHRRSGHRVFAIGLDLEGELQRRPQARVSGSRWRLISAAATPRP